MTLLIQLKGIIGIVVLLGIAWALSAKRRHIPWRTIAWGVGLQIIFALLILKTSPGQRAFEYIRQGASRLISFSSEGAVFLFGALGKQGQSLKLMDQDLQPIDLGFTIAFQVLPVIVFFSSLMAILYHFGLMQRIVQAFAWGMRRTMRLSGAESVAVAANVVVGHVESPLAVRPYLSNMTTSELATVMTAGFATVAGSVLAAYIGFGVDAGHLLAASVMSAPAAVVIAKMMYPETETPETDGDVKHAVEKTTVNVIDAAALGATQGLKIAALVGGMLIAFVSLIGLINYFLSFAGTSLGDIFGYIFAPIAWCMGVESGDMLEVGRLLGTKVAVNELVGYLQLVDLQAKGLISERSFVIATYALCGFANFGSIAIALGGLGGIIPDRRAELARLGLKTMLGGALASWLTASIAGIMV